MDNINAVFIAGASDTKSLPKNQNLPEIAFAGRSNVGKSSLLNSLVLRKNLAHISSNPGKTQQINFYNVESKWCFVDLPGYGYATTSKENRLKWQDLNLNYLAERENLKLVCILVDSRHKPDPKDLAIIEFLENNFKRYVVIMTKADKITKSEIEGRKKEYSEILQFCNYSVDVIAYSSITRIGRSELFGIIKKYSAKKFEE